MFIDLIGIFFAFLATIGYGLSSATAKIPVKEFGNIPTIFFRNILATLIIFIIMLATTLGYTFNMDAAVFTLLLSIIGYLGLIFLYKALHSAKVGVILPILSSTSIFTIVFSFIFFQEVLPAKKLLQIFLIISGVMLFSVQFKDFRNSQIFKKQSGIVYALATCILWGLMFAFIRTPVKLFGPIYTSFFMEAGVLVLSFFTLLITRADIKIPKKPLRLHIGLVAIFSVMGTVFFNVAAKYISVSIVSAVSATRSLVAALFAKKVLKEEFASKQIIAIILSVVGLIILALS